MRELAHEYACHWFFTPTPVEKAGGLWPIRSGYNRAKPHFKVGPRVIHYYSLHFVLKGKGTIVQGNTTRQLKGGDLFCLYHGLTHQYYTEPEHPLELFWLAFDGKQALTLLNRIGLSLDCYHFEDFMNQELSDTINEIMSHFKQEIEDDELIRLGLIFKLFHYLTLQAKARYAAPGTAIDWIHKSKQYMDMHYAEGISVSDVAKYVGVHRSHLTTSFVKTFSVAPAQYLADLKMARACQMIEEHAHTMTEIAYSLGYPDLYSFSKAFKKHHGVSPRHATRNARVL